MIHVVKVLSIAVATAVAIGTFVAPSAFAQQGQLTSDGPVKVNLTQTGAVGSGSNAITAFAGKIECPASTYQGSRYNVTPHELVESGTTTLTVTPTYANCFTESGGVFSTTIDMNGCDYVINIGKSSVEHSYGVTTDIVCPEGQNVQATVFLGPSHTTVVCKTTIKPQVGLAGPKATTDTSADDVTIVGAFENLHVERTGLCGANTTTEGKIDIDVTLKGSNGEGASTGLTITG